VVHPEGGCFVENFVVTASIPTEKPPLPQYELEGEDPSAAQKGARSCYWGKGGFEDSPVYEYTELKAGNVITGPSILETEYTTLVLPPGLRCSIDRNLFSRIERA
jgi:N-methylhydantoinase A/acetophenone carboxylase